MASMPSSKYSSGEKDVMINIPVPKYLSSESSNYISFRFGD